MVRMATIERQAWRLVLLCFLLLPAGSSMAAACGASGMEAAGLMRQIAANVTFQQRHACLSGGAGFACREIAARIVKARASLAALQPACEKPGVTVAAMPRRTERSKARSVEPARPVAAVTAPRIETMCVRLSDGYYFPTPNSGFRTGEAAEAIAAQCRYICDDPDMAVFQRSSDTPTSDDMVSMTDGTQYADLPHAGAYRRAAAARTCDVSRFYRTVLQTAPVATPAVETMSPAADAALFRDVGLRGTSTFLPPPPRRVRRVGPAFLPDE